MAILYLDTIIAKAATSSDSENLTIQPSHHQKTWRPILVQSLGVYSLPPNARPGPTVGARFPLTAHTVFRLIASWAVCGTSALLTAWRYVRDTAGNVRTVLAAPAAHTV